ncbi:unnamed protein product [marine sediment metagenome]|uniref:Uncharacterized protein n=1 Tax=marine sediment metagenome TaxID=412755 RepID=X1BNI4_9ZZZZ
MLFILGYFRNIVHILRVLVGVFKEKISDEKDENIYICGYSLNNIYLVGHTISFGAGASDLVV